MEPFLWQRFVAPGGVRPTTVLSELMCSFQQLCFMLICNDCKSWQSAQCALLVLQHMLPCICSGKPLSLAQDTSHKAEHM